MPSDMHDIPDQYGEGALFAFSGVDGPTGPGGGFVASLTAARYGLLFHTAQRRSLHIALPGESSPRLVTHNVLHVASEAGPLWVSFAAWHTIIGTCPQDAVITLAFGGEARDIGADATVFAPDWRDTLVVMRRGDRFAVSIALTPWRAWWRARDGLGLDAVQVAATRSAFVVAVGVTSTDGATNRLLRKCASVMAVNTLRRKNGDIWSTPDRVPHRHMWLWDSAFHAVGMRHLDARIAWEYLRAVLQAQRRDGMISIRVTTRGMRARRTQPPVLAWAVWKVYEVLGDRAMLREARPRLEAYLRWNKRNRQAANGLYRWATERKALSRADESGMDNSPRFDGGAQLDAVEFSVYMALDWWYLGGICKELHERAAATVCFAEAERITQAIHAQLWNEDVGFYCDRYPDGSFSPILACTGFMPLLLEGIDPARVQSLLDKLHDPAHFGAAVPVPSVSLSDPAFSTDMWRGPMWVNTNGFIIRGLQQQGEIDAARALTRKTIETVDRYYREYGVVFEFYDARDEVPPPRLDRKGPLPPEYDIRRKIHTIRDYHWTAALTLDLLYDPPAELP